MTNDYTRPARTPFPRELATMIARKADALARRFEDQAIERLVSDAQRALDRGMTPADIAREMSLR